MHTIPQSNQNILNMLFDDNLHLNLSNYMFDTNDIPVMVSENDSQTKHEYDADQRIIKRTITATKSESIQLFEYNSAGELTSMTITRNCDLAPDCQIRYDVSYDDKNNLTSISSSDYTLHFNHLKKTIRI